MLALLLSALESKIAESLINDKAVKYFTCMVPLPPLFNFSISQPAIFLLRQLISPDRPP